MAAEPPLCNRGFDQGQLWSVQSSRCKKQIKGIDTKAKHQGKGRCEISSVHFFLYTGKKLFPVLLRGADKPGQAGRVEEKRQLCPAGQ